LVMGDMWIEGSDGVIRLNGDGGLFMRAHDRNTETELAYDWQNVGFGGDCVYRLNKHVLECLADGTQPMNTATAYLENLRIVEAVYQSDDAGARVDL